MGPKKYHTEYDFNGIHYKVARELTSDSEITDVSKLAGLPVVLLFFQKIVVSVVNDDDAPTVSLCFLARN